MQHDDLSVTPESPIILIVIMAIKSPCIGNIVNADALWYMPNNIEKVYWQLSKTKLRSWNQHSVPSPTASPLHIIGVNWVTRFLNRNTVFEKICIRYQERIKGTKLQACFLRNLPIEEKDYFGEYVEP